MTYRIRCHPRVGNRCNCSDNGGGVCCASYGRYYGGSCKEWAKVETMDRYRITKRNF